jgi:hypothetical protein
MTMRARLERKTQDEFVYEGFGFPIVLVHVPMVRVRGAWTPDVDLNELSRVLLAVLPEKPARLTGSEVRFIRHSLSMTLEDFARRFDVTHPAVIKWERSGDQPTSMAWAIEKDIRLEVVKLTSPGKPSKFLQTFQGLAKIPAKKAERVRIDLRRPA